MSTATHSRSGDESDKSGATESDEEYKEEEEEEEVRPAVALLPRRRRRRCDRVGAAQAESACEEPLLLRSLRAAAAELLRG